MQLATNRRVPTLAAMLGYWLDVATLAVGRIGGMNNICGMNVEEQINEKLHAATVLYPREVVISWERYVGGGAQSNIGAKTRRRREKLSIELAGEKRNQSVLAGRPDSGKTL